MIKLLKFLRPYRGQVGLIIGLVSLQMLSDLYLPTLLSDIVNNGVMKQDVGYIWRIGGWMLLIALGGTLCAITAGYLSSRVAMGFGKILRAQIFEHVEGFSLHEVDKIGIPSLITRTTNDVTQIQMVIMVILRMMIGAPIMMVGGIIMALLQDRHLSWILAMALPLLAALITFISIKGLPLFRAIQTRIDRVNLIVRENLEGIRVIRAFNRTHHETARFQAANHDLTETTIRVNRLMALMMPSMMLIMNLVIVAIVWFGSVNVDRGTLEIGNMMAFFQYAMQIMMALLMASMLFIMIPRAQASADRIHEVLAITPEIQDPGTPRRSQGQTGHVEFRNVTFRYHGAEEPALQDVSFEALPGEFVAIIGGTGAGKSTLVSLIPRFYDVSSGAVLVDGVDVREMPLKELRARIGFVPQRAVLFSGTVADNIRYGKPEATDNEVRHAAEVAQAIDFVSEMKDDFNSDIAQGGANLSGGQKQRLAIARALVKKPEIYVFDDSFSALDFKTDARLRAALRKETGGATVFIVAQRVSTVMDADRIVVLHEGRVVGLGTHRELLQSCQVYREIVASQLSEEEIA